MLVGRALWCGISRILPLLSQIRVPGVSLSQVHVRGRTLSVVRAALLDMELRYVADDGVVVTTLGEVDEARLAGGRPVRLPRSRAGQRHYCGRAVLVGDDEQPRRVREPLGA